MCIAYSYSNTCLGRYHSVRDISSSRRQAAGLNTPKYTSARKNQRGCFDKIIIRHLKKNEAKVVGLHTLLAPGRPRADVLRYATDMHAL